MTCQEYKDRVTVQLADGSESPGDHGASCSECGRYAERARAVWEAAGRLPDEAVPAAVSEKLMRSCRRPRRSDLFLLRPGSVAAAALLTVGALILFLPGRAGPGSRSMMDPDGMSVERYDLPAGASPSAVAEELRRKVSPEAWTEGVGGLEEGEGFLRVRGPAELQRGVREFLRRYGR
jgi:hypothetical protein